MSGNQAFSFVGIEPLATSDVFSFVSLDDHLSLVAIGKGTFNDIFAFLAGQKMSRTAIHAPAFLGSSHNDDEVQKHTPFPAKEYRRCEHQLWQANIPINFTPAALNRLSLPARHGFQLFQTLQQYGFLLTGQSDAAKIIMESSPAACFHQLVNTLLVEEESLLWRLQHQLILHNHHLPVDDPMDFFEEITRHKLLLGKVSLESILIPEELNAMVLAFTAWLSHYQPEKVTAWGEASDGFLMLPVQNKQP